jgi:hypothetical protein
MVQGDGLAQLAVAHAVGVMGVAVLERPAGGRLHAGGGVEVGLAHLEVDHVNAAALHLLGLFEHVHHDEGAQLWVRFGNHCLVSYI